MNGILRKRPLPRLYCGQKRLKSASETSDFLSNSNGGCLTPTQSPQVFPFVLFENDPNISPGKDKKDDKDRIGPYRVLGEFDETGFCSQAIDTRNKESKVCQLLTLSQYEHVLKVSERMDKQDSYHQFGEQLRESILPSDFDIVTGNDGGRYAFTSQHYGTLHGYIQNIKILTEAQVRPLFGKIVKLVAFCHKIGIVVRDLKLRKFVFVDEEMTQLRLASIDDLVVCETARDDRLCDRHGCPAYVSPEILDLDQPNYSGRSADLWSLGVVLFVMLIGRYPFYDNTPAGLFGKIRQAQFCLPDDKGLSGPARAVLHGLLRKDPTERPTAQQLMFVPWLQSKDIVDPYKKKRRLQIKELDQLVPSVD